MAAPVSTLQGITTHNFSHLEFSLWLYFHEQGLTEWLICSPMMGKTHLTDKQTCLNAFSLLNNSIWVKKPFLWFFSYQKLNWSWIRGWYSHYFSQYFLSVFHGLELIGSGYKIFGRIELFEDQGRFSNRNFLDGALRNSTGQSDIELRTSIWKPLLADLSTRTMYRRQSRNELLLSFGWISLFSLKTWYK